MRTADEHVGTHQRVVATQNATSIATPGSSSRLNDHDMCVCVCKMQGSKR